MFIPNRTHNTPEGGQIDITSDNLIKYRENKNLKLITDRDSILTEIINFNKKIKNIENENEKEKENENENEKEKPYDFNKHPETVSSELTKLINSIKTKLNYLKGDIDKYNEPLIPITCNKSPAMLLNGKYLCWEHQEDNQLHLDPQGREICKQLYTTENYNNANKNQYHRIKICKKHMCRLCNLNYVGIGFERVTKTYDDKSYCEKHFNEIFKEKNNNCQYHSGKYR